MGFKKKLGMSAMIAALGLSLIGEERMRTSVIKKYHKTRLQLAL